jgi:hypothetical protein
MGNLYEEAAKATRYMIPIAPLQRLCLCAKLPCGAFAPRLPKHPTKECVSLVYLVARSSQMSL